MLGEALGCWDGGSAIVDIDLRWDSGNLFQDSASTLLIELVGGRRVGSCNRLMAAPASFPNLPYHTLAVHGQW